MTKIVKIVSDTQLTSSEVGHLLQVNPSSVKKWVDDGEIIAFRTPGGHRRIRALDLLEFLKRHKMPIPADLQEVGRKRVLLVDDNPAQLTALARSLRRHSEKLEVMTVNNGIDALVLVGSHHPHFVVLDVFMPEVDGIEVCRRLKKRNETKDVQVVIVSGGLNAAVERKALEAGAVQCFPKPIDTHALLACLLAPPADARRAV